MPKIAILDPPTPAQMLTLPPGFGPRYLLTIDTEEDFDWSAPLRRDGYRLDSLDALAAFQAFCEGYGARPVYLVDYPVATAPVAIATLSEAVAAGRAEVGAQLHPWVNPPFDEALTPRNSFAGNLPFALERAKLRALIEAITSHFGEIPAIYRAGRYGVGPNTARILAEAGVAIDSSVRAYFDYSAQSGPDFHHLGARPWRLRGPEGLIALPFTTVFTGALRGLGPRLLPAVERHAALRGALAKTGLLARVPLTPEGVTIAEAIRAIDIALAVRLPVLVFAFHSPSLRPGCTPYVRDAGDLAGLYTWWRAIFAHLARRGVAAITARELATALVLASPGAAG